MTPLLSALLTSSTIFAASLGAAFALAVFIEARAIIVGLLADRDARP